MNHSDFENILSNAKGIYKTLKAAPSCPDDEMLSEYVYHDLPTEEYRKVAAHIHQCERCRIESLRMKTDKDAWELMVDQYPDEMFEKLLGSSISEQQDYAADLSKIVGSAVSKIRDSLIRWLSPIWEPMWAGVPVSAAADIPEQSHSFEMNYGEYVNISCYWQGKSNDLMPYIQLGWNANIYTNSNLWARFVNPENQQILAEFCLGIELEGRKIFYESELGFDPSKQKWAISIVIEKI